MPYVPGKGKAARREGRLSRFPALENTATQAGAAAAAAMRPQEAAMREAAVRAHALRVGAIVAALWGCQAPEALKHRADGGTGRGGRGAPAGGRGPRAARRGRGRGAPPTQAAAAAPP